MIYDLIAQDYLLQALQAPDLPTSVRATLNLFGGDPATAVTQMPIEMRQLLRTELLDPTILASMLLSAHLIIFWLSQDSNVTPPVCLTAFAAAGIAGTRPMATGMTFSTTGRSRSTSRARNTSAMPPRPTLRSTS
jgi:TRAP-type uncharacterized transport system fused permease subunit